MSVPKRLNPADARVALTSGVNEALLVCAYASESECRANELEGSISLAEFERGLPAVPKNHQIIFYCA